MWPREFDFDLMGDLMKTLYAHPNLRPAFAILMAMALGLSASVSSALAQSDDAAAKRFDRIERQLREVRDTGITVLLVEQNVKSALALADRAAVLVEGKERIVGDSADLLNDERVAALYLGRHTGKQAVGEAM